MSSPNLNNMIILGCLLSYTNIYFIGLYEGLVSNKTLSYVCAVSRLNSAHYFNTLNIERFFYY